MKRALFETIKASTYTSGATIDRDGFLSAVLAVDVSAVTGSPESIAVSLTVTHSDTSDGTFEAVSDERLLPLGNDHAIDPAGGNVNVPVDLLGCKRYVQITAAITFQGGTSPASTDAYALVLGDASFQPV